MLLARALSTFRRTAPAAFALALSLAATPALAVEVTVVDPLKPIYDEGSVEDAGGRGLQMCAPRNGAASAQIVVTGDGAGSVRAQVSALVGPDGALPADAVQVRYAAIEKEWSYDKPKNAKPEWVFNYTDAYHDRLLPAPELDATVVPVWVTVTVPADAAPGQYKGEVKVAGTDVDVDLVVADWACPVPADWAAHVGVVASPEILALTYKVPFWSDEHWALVERELAFMGMIGADDLWLHGDANMGFQQGLAMIRFTREGDRIVPDLAVTEKYIDLFARHVGRPEFVIINLWTGQTNRRDRDRGRGGIYVFVDGEKEMIPRPEDGPEIWRPVMEGIHALVERKGWPEDSILLGLAGDQRPRPETIEAYKNYAPYARWAIWTHGRGEKPVQHFNPDEPLVYSNGMEIGYYAHPYTPTPKGWLRPPDKPVSMGQLLPHLQGGWNQNRMILSTARNDIHKYAAPSQWRTFPNGMTLGYEEIGFGDTKGSAGFAFVWLDFWRVQGDAYVFSYQPFICRLCDVMSRANSPSMIEPGPDGPVPTVRFEMLREGLQETEARVTIERALVEGKLPGPLAEEAKALLTEAFNVRFKDGKFSGGHAGSSLGNPSSMWGVKPYPAWIDATFALYEMAGKVRAARE